MTKVNMPLQELLQIKDFNRNYTGVKLHKINSSKKKAFSIMVITTVYNLLQETLIFTPVYLTEKSVLMIII